MASLRTEPRACLPEEQQTCQCVGMLLIRRPLPLEPRASGAHDRARMDVTYRTDGPLDLDQVIELYHASTLGARRPVDDRARMQRMLETANLIVTAWEGPLLVGISRTLTDFAYVAYLADLAVRVSH